jgi:hypothetical protein
MYLLVPGRGRLRGARPFDVTGSLYSLLRLLVIRVAKAYQGRDLMRTAGEVIQLARCRARRAATNSRAVGRRDRHRSPAVRARPSRPPGAEQPLDVSGAEGDAAAGDKLDGFEHSATNVAINRADGDPKQVGQLLPSYECMRGEVRRHAD